MRGIIIVGRRISLLLTILLIFILSSVSTFALTVPDISRIGSISITMTDPVKKEAVPGGNLILYKVGEVHVDDANYSWVLSSDFAGSGADLSDLESEELTAKLADYAAKESITPIQTAEIDENGKAVVKDLPVALYLIIQTESALGYKAVMPFLVTIPMGNNEEGWVYDVDASPKVELEAGTGNSEDDYYAQDFGYAEDYDHTKIDYHTSYSHRQGYYYSQNRCHHDC